MKKNFKNKTAFTAFMLIEFMLTMIGFIIYATVNKFMLLISIIFLVQILFSLCYFFYSFQFKNKMYEEYLKTENKIILNPLIELKYENLYFYPITFIKQKDYENYYLKIQKYLRKENSYLINQESYENINSKKFNLHLRNLNKIISNNFKLNTIVIWNNSNVSTIEIVYIKKRIFIMK